MSSSLVEFFGCPVKGASTVDWAFVAKRQLCPYLGRKCLKVRKSRAGMSIGTCVVEYGRAATPVMICPHRFLERRQIFADCIHLLSLHEPGNEFHVVSEITVPGGSVDYFLVSARSRKVRDFVGIELQTLDTTGTVWPERQRFLKSHGVTTVSTDTKSAKGFGMNWKMTAKTTLVQLHHKVETFGHLGKHFVLVLQDCLLAYMQREFVFDHIGNARLGDPMHFHAYSLRPSDGKLRLDLTKRLSTDADGITRAMGLQAEAAVELKDIVVALESKMSDSTIWVP